MKIWIQPQGEKTGLFEIPKLSLNISVEDFKVLRDKSNFERGKILKKLLIKNEKYRSIKKYRRWNIAYQNLAITKNGFRRKQLSSMNQVILALID